MILCNFGIGVRCTSSMYAYQPIPIYRASTPRIRNVPSLLYRASKPRTQLQLDHEVPRAAHPRCTTVLGHFAPLLHSFVKCGPRGHHAGCFGQGGGCKTLGRRLLNPPKGIVFNMCEVGSASSAAPLPLPPPVCFYDLPETRRAGAGGQHPALPSHKQEYLRKGDDACLSDDYVNPLQAKLAAIKAPARPKILQKAADVDFNGTHTSLENFEMGTKESAAKVQMLRVCRLPRPTPLPHGRAVLRWDPHYCGFHPPPTALRLHSFPGDLRRGSCRCFS